MDQRGERMDWGLTGMEGRRKGDQKQAEAGRRAREGG